MNQKGNVEMASNFKDRKTGLVVFGILEMLFGLFCLLMFGLMMFSLFATTSFSGDAAPPPTVGMMAPAVLFYILLGVGFIWMGIGSVMARRWARALLLVGSWLWLVTGVSAMVFMLVLLPDLYDQMGANGEVPQEAVTVMKWVMVGVLTVFYVVLPGVLVLFYGSRHVKATCEQRDPHVRWTDRCPLPVLAVSLTAGLWTACMPLMGFSGWAVPFFGIILDGASGAAVALLGMLLLGVVAYGTYRLRTEAWWLAAGLTVAWGLSGSITFSQVSWMDFYEKMNFPAEQLQLMEQYSLMQTHWMTLLTALWPVAALAYLVYVRRFFTAPESGAESGRLGVGAGHR